MNTYPSGDHSTVSFESSFLDIIAKVGDETETDNEKPLNAHTQFPPNDFMGSHSHAKNRFVYIINLIL